MRHRLERLLEHLDRRGRARALVGLAVKTLLFEAERLPDPPRYGLAGPDRGAIFRALRAEHDRIWAMTYENVLDEVPPEERLPITVPNGLPVVCLVEVFCAEGYATVQMRVEVDEPACCYLGEGPAFAVGRDGTREPDDAGWEADWR